MAFLMGKAILLLCKTELSFAGLRVVSDRVASHYQKQARRRVAARVAVEYLVP